MCFIKHLGTTTGFLATIGHKRLYGLFTLPDSNTDSDSDLDCKPKFVMATLYYVEIFTLYSQNQIQIPVVTPNYRNGIGIEIWICE